MKKEFSKILGVGLTVALLVSLIVVVAPVSAGTLKWTTFSPYPTTTSEILEACNITDIAVSGDGEVIYASGGNRTQEEGLVYKSTDGGRSWSTSSVSTNTSLIAVAPDDSDIIAVADNESRIVWVSTDGGTTWGSLGIPQESGGTTAGNVTDIAISAESSGKHYVAVCGDEPDGAAGAVANAWYWDIGAASPYWHELNDKTGFNDTTAETVRAVAFSPNFPSDQTMAVLTEDDGDDVVLELYSYNQSKWNDDAGFDGYAVPVIEDDGITNLVSASIALSPDYLGSDDSLRLAFIAVTLDGDTDAEKYNGLYRASDTTVKALKDGTSVKLHSVTYDGATLVTGRFDSNICYYSLDPTATTPTVSSTRPLKRPGISTNTRTVVAWAGDEVVGGTTGDESAFAVSTNDGKSFSDVSLINTTLNNVTDVAVSPDGSVIYLTTDDATDMSLWRYESSWERILAVPAKTAFLVRIAPDDSDVVYVADRAGTTIYYSGDGGTERWQTRTSRYSIQDLAVEGSGDVAYVIINADGKVSKSSNSGFTWGTSKSSKLSGGYMIVSLGEDLVIAGSDDGYMSYSSDGGDSFTKISKQLGSTSANVSVTATGVADGDYVYAGLGSASKDIYRWQLGTSTSWSSIGEDTDYPVTGITLQDGVLYAMCATSGGHKAEQSVIFRSLDPDDGVAPTWSTSNITTEFNIWPQSFKVGGGSSTIWAVDNATLNDVLYSYTDTLAILGPELVGPAQGFEVGINPISGYTSDVTFSWLKPSARVTDYELRLAFDSDFAEVAKKLYPDSTSSTVGYVVGHSATGTFDLMPGDTYYWKVRVTTPLYSPWSVYRYVTVEEAPLPVTEVTVQPAAAPEITVEAPPPPQVTVTVPPTPAPVTAPPAIPAYLLWTIICIGAVLIIALIVLIVRTRRVV